MTKNTLKMASKTKTEAYDVAKYLRTPEEMALYLDAWFEDALDDVAGITRALGDIARTQ
jgi:DNA-binding phage protein